MNIANEIWELIYIYCDVKYLFGKAVLINKKMDNIVNSEKFLELYMKNGCIISDFENHIEVNKSIKYNYIINDNLTYNKNESHLDFELGIQNYIAESNIYGCTTKKDIESLYEKYRERIDNTNDLMYTNIIYVNNYKEKLRLAKELTKIFKYPLFGCIGNYEDIVENFIKQSLSICNNIIFIDPRIQTIQTKYLHINNNDTCYNFYKDKTKTTIQQGLLCVIDNINCSHSYADAFFAFIDTNFYVWETITKYQTIDDLYLNIQIKSCDSIQIYYHDSETIDSK